MKQSGGGHMAKEEASPARIAIIEEWDAWAKKHPERARIAGGIRFFNYLQDKRADLLLDFRSSSSKWETIHSWLLTAQKVRR
jgi:hypothetical protein